MKYLQLQCYVVLLPSACSVMEEVQRAVASLQVCTCTTLFLSYRGGRHTKHEASLCYLVQRVFGISCFLAVAGTRQH